VRVAARGRDSLIFLLAWAGFVVLAFGPESLFGPNLEGPALLALVQELFRFRGADPISVASFQLLGVLPLAYARILLRDGEGQPLPAWPFVALSFALGGAALLLYLAVRRPGAPARGGPRALVWFTSSWVPALALVAAALALAGWAALRGDGAALVREAAENRFIRTYLVDLSLLGLAYPWVWAQDRRLRPQPASGAGFVRAKVVR
jgi:hypothetical protein